eukprot:m.512111 g.512111  ORF g.512111 m.512111 type:complete len:54 (+) comp103861_c0_seq1:233-394(+)
MMWEFKNCAFCVVCVRVFVRMWACSLQLVILSVFSFSTALGQPVLVRSGGEAY